MSSPRRPTREELLAAVGRSMPDIVAPDLKVLFCGINPSLYSAVVGHHFARPGNRFWPTLHAAGFTERVFAPHEDRSLLPLGYGITNVVDRATASADDLSPADLAAGGRALRKKVLRLRPCVLAVLGIGAYRTAFEQPRAAPGIQPRTLGTTALWVLPNPSGLNASYQRGDLARLYRELKDFLDRPAP